ncbi:MAG: DNA alkylation repair protein [Pseudodesulfovibrio sp.]
MAGELKAEISQEFITELVRAISLVQSEFDGAGFTKSVFDSSWETLELKARIHHVALQLGAFLPENYPDSIGIIHQIANQFGGLPSLVFPEFIELFGFAHWDESMEALAEFTALSSSEFAVRLFIRLDEERMMAQMITWAESDNFHERRLASEGCRPRLPWASPLRRFIADPHPVLPILERLKDDEELYVRRSVANNLNDISKDHPEVALDLSKRWIGQSKDVDWVVKHGLRTLLKRGDTTALQLFGYDNPSDIVVEGVHFSDGETRIGESNFFEFDIVVSGDKEKKLRVEYAMYFLKANGKLSKKVFQMTEKTFEPGVHSMKKKHSFYQLSTRKHYPGIHELAVHINGCELVRIPFELLP